MKSRILFATINLIFSSVVFAQIPSYVPLNGLVGWWPFNGNANDESGNGNNGTVNGASLTTDRNSLPNSAYYFSSAGCGTRIDASVNTATIQTGLTISIWVLRSGNGCIGPRLFEFWPGNNGPGQAQWGWDNSTSAIGMGSTTSSGFACNSSVPIPSNNVWIHLVYTNDGSLGKFYSNGALISTVASNGNPILAGSVSFGRMNHPAWDAFNGKLDDIGVWSRALTDCEVQQLYLSQVNSSANVNAGPDQTVCSVSPVTLTATGASTYAWTGGIQNGVPFIPTASGQYIVTGTNANGCTGIDTVQISLIPSPTITSLDTLICAGESTTLTVSAPAYGQAQGCTGISPVNYSTWTEIAQTSSYTNIIKEGSNYFLRSQTNVFQASSLIGPWNSMNFNTQIGNTIAQRMLGFDWSNRLIVSTGHNSLYAYNNGTWQDIGLGGFGCGGNFIHKLQNGRIIVEKNGYLRDLYISDNNAVSYTNVTNVDNDYFDMIVAPNGNIYACGGSNTPSMTGLIKSTNNGSSFTQINSQLGISFCSGFAKDCSGNIYAVCDNKIFKSVDGNNWVQHCLIPSYFTSTPWYSFLVIASSGDYYLWSATNTLFGLFKSSNQGLTWVQITDLPTSVANITNLKEIDANIIAVTTQGIFAKTLIQAPTYVWSNGATTPSITVSPNSSTTYTCTVTYPNGTSCTSSQLVVIDNISVNAGPDLTVSSGSSVTLTATGATFYSWSGGIQNGVSFTPTSTQTYVVSGTNAQGCIGSDTVVVNVLPPPVISITATATSICAGDSISLTSLLNQTSTLSLNFPYTKLNGTEIWVSPSGNNSSGTGTFTNPYQTIQHAVNVAVNGQYVTLKNGTYSGPGNVNVNTLGKQITIQSENGPLSTIIDCNLSGRAFIVNSGESMNTIIKGVKIINGKTNSAPLGYGSAIFVEDNSGLKIIDCIFQNNIEGCVQFGDNEVSGPQSAIENCAFIQNQVSCIGATKKSFYTESCFFYDNTSNGELFGNGHVANPAQYYQNCIFKCNTGNVIGALGHGKLMNNSLFIGNTSTQGTIYMGTNWSGTNTIDHCTFYNNTCNFYNSGWYDHTGQVLSSIFYPGNARNHVSGNQSQIPFSNSLGDNITGNGNIQGNPLFVNPSLNNFQLQSSSPCIGTGALGTNMGANVSLIQPWLFNFLDYYSQGFPNVLWSNGAITPSITLAPSASGYINVTYSGCGTNISDSIFIQVSPLTIINAGPDQTVCAGESVTLTATGASTYTWTGGVQNGVPFFPTASGQYMVSGTNANGCTDTDTLNLSINPPIIATATVTNNLCGNASGSILLAVSGGTSPYTYLWSNTAITQDILNIGSGTYIVQITDANGCQLIDTFQVQQANSMTLTSNIVNPTCSNLANGSIDISLAGGTPPFVYNWSNNANTQDISNLLPGNYTLSVTDANGCVQNGTYVLSAPSAISITFNSNTIGCFGAAVGQVTSTVSGGLPPYIYNWNNGATTSNLTNVVAGNYSLTVNDAGGCSESASVTIQQPQNQFILSAALTNVTCYGQNNGAIDLTATGGTLLYTYNWNNGLFTTPDISNLVAGNYIVNITDGNGCVYDSTFTITQPNQALQLQTSQVNLNCQNGNNGFVDLSVSGGSQPYTYLWSSGQTTEDIFNLTAGLYSVAVTDQNGCTETSSLTLTEPVIPFELTATISDAICFGSASGSIDLSVSGGMAPFTFIWSNNASSEDLTNIIAGTYDVVVLDANGCQANALFIVSQPTFALQASYQVVNVACSANETGSIDVSTFGGVAPYVFLWNTGASTEDLNNLGAGNYSLSITDASGCQLSLSINIQAPSFPLQTNPVVTNVSCHGENDGEINLIVTGGNTPYTFLWSSGQNTALIDSLIADTYSVVVTDANGCENNLTIPVSQPSMINTNFGVSSNFVCIPQEVTFNYPINDPTLSFEWDFGNGNTSTLQNPTVIFDNAGCFTVTLTVSSANGCVVGSTQDSMICAVVGPTADFYSSSNVIDFYTGELQLFDDSEGSVVGYEWSFGDTSPNTTEENPIHYFPSAIANSYLVSLVVSDTNGCTDSIDQIFELIEDFNIYVPNTITINGDELNEVFLPIFSNVDLIGDYQLQIFNRWGQLVWSTTEPAEGWDGRYKGNKSVQQGAYTWKLKYTNNLMVTRTLAGHVTILR
jgi:gliding motility-associated-like protein